MRALLIGLLAAILMAGCSAAGPTTATPAGSVPATTGAPASTAPTIGASLAPTPTPAPTPSPTPSPSFLSIVKKFLAAKHPAATPTAVIAAIKAAYAADPAPMLDRQNPQDLLLRLFTGCWKGEPDPTHTMGDPLNTRSGDCGSVVIDFLLAYHVSGNKAHYDAALTAYNYAYHALPKYWVKGNIDDYLLQVAAQMP
jgi:hypothetical protein